MNLLSDLDLNPEIKSVEDYFNNLSDIDFDTLLEIATLETNTLNDEDLSDLATLAINIYSTEMDINPEIVVKDTDMIKTLIKRFLSSIIIYSLIRKGLIAKVTTEDMTLYKDYSFKLVEN